MSNQVAHREGDTLEEEPPPPNPYKAGEEEVMWHKVKAYLKDPRGPKPIVACAVCLEELRIKGLGSSNDEDTTATTSGGSTTGISEFAVVLPCGHMIGLGCLKECNRIRWENELPCRCPTCNFELRYRGCYDTIQGILAPAEEHHVLGRVPPTVPEGGQVPMRCNRCRAVEVKRSARRIGDYIWNPYMELDGDVPTRSTEFLAFVKERLKEQMEEERSPNWADRRHHLWHKL